jgi:hypothetical protein
VRVPNDAKPGKVIVRVEMHSARYKSFATDLPFVIE